MQQLWQQQSTHSPFHTVATEQVPFRALYHHLECVVACTTHKQRPLARHLACNATTRAAQARTTAAGTLEVLPSLLVLLLIDLLCQLGVLVCQLFPKLLVGDGEVRGIVEFMQPHSPSHSHSHSHTHVPVHQRGQSRRLVLDPDPVASVARRACFEGV